MLNLDIPSLDDTLFDLLDVFVSPIQSSSQEFYRGLVQWEETVASAGVYNLAAQGVAAIGTELVTATDDRMTAIGLAYSLMNFPSFTPETLLALSIAKTFEDRLAIYKEKNAKITTLLMTHIVLVMVRNKKHKADEEFERKVKNAVVKIFGGSNTAPAAESQKFFSIKEAAEYCRVAEKTVRNWLQKLNPDGSPMLPGVKWKGREYRIPRSALEPWRKPEKAPSRKTMSSTKRKK